MGYPRNVNQARTLANIAERAKRITEEYRLIWNRHERCFYVAHNTDRARRYSVTSYSCACISAAKHGECKHFLGLPELARAEIKRYTLLGWQEDRERMEEFLGAIEMEAAWKDNDYVDRMAEFYTGL